MSQRGLGSLELKKYLWVSPARAVLHPYYLPALAQVSHLREAKNQKEVFAKDISSKILLIATPSL